MIGEAAQDQLGVNYRIIYVPMGFNISNSFLEDTFYGGLFWVDFFDQLLCLKLNKNLSYITISHSNSQNCDFIFWFFEIEARQKDMDFY